MVMTFKSNNSTSNSNADFSKYSYETKSNNNQNSNDLSESISRSLDQTKDNINRSIDESRNQIPRYNNIVNSYQEQSLQTAKEISEEYIESQKAVINSLQSAWRPYSESYTSLISSFASPDSITQAYTKCVSSFADNAVSAIRLTNCFIFSNLDSMKSMLQQARDNSKHISNLASNAAKTFEQNSMELAASIEESVTNYNKNNLDNNYEDTDNITIRTNLNTVTTTATTKQ